MYHLDNMQSKILRFLKSEKITLEEGKLRDLFSFLNTKNLIKKGLIKHVYFKNDQAPFFIDENQMNLVKEEFFKNTNLEIPIKKIFKTDIEEKALLKFKTDSLNNYEEVLSVFIDNSEYGKQYKIKNEVKNEKKEAKKREIEKKHEANRQEKFEIFDKLSSLNRNFNDLRIVAIDLEFFLNKKNKTHKISELGVSYISRQEMKENGILDSKKINEHILVEEYYELKKNRKNQENFSFGKSKVLPLKEVKVYLEFLLKNVDIVLFHEKREDLAALSEIGVDVESYKNVTIMDTQTISTRYFAKNFDRKSGESKMELEDLLKNLNVDYNKGDFHNAGNDAEYTLRLLFEMKKRYDNNKIKMTNKKMEIENSKSDPIKDAINLLKKESEKRGISIQNLINEYEKKNTFNKFKP